MSSSNKYERAAQVESVSNELGITRQLAKELLKLAGGDEELVIKCSRSSNGLNHCKASIIDRRMSRLEDKE